MNTRILMTLASTLALAGTIGCASTHGDNGSAAASSSDTGNGTSRRADAGDGTVVTGEATAEPHSAGNPSCDNPATNQNSDECKRR